MLSVCIVACSEIVAYELGRKTCPFIKSWICKVLLNKTHVDFQALRITYFCFTSVCYSSLYVIFFGLNIVITQQDTSNVSSFSRATSFKSAELTEIEHTLSLYGYNSILGIPRSSLLFIIFKYKLHNTIAHHFVQTNSIEMNRKCTESLDYPLPHILSSPLQTKLTEFLSQQCLKKENVSGRRIDGEVGKRFRK